MEATIIYDNKKDREFLEKVTLEAPLFINYIDIVKNKKEGFKVLNYYGAVKLPFVELLLDKEENRCKPFYSENGNAIFQLIDYINNVYDPSAI